MASDAEGHVLGNFHAYYSFNPVHERLRFMDVQTANALRRALLVKKPAEDKSEATCTVLDVGCNEGDLTIGLYDATLNERMQKNKKQVGYLIQDEGETSHRRRYVCELQIDGKTMGHGEGVSKKVAKAKAAEVALRALDGTDDKKQQKEMSADKKIGPEQLSLTEEELATRKPLMVLGVDIDEVLVERAAKKLVHLTEGDAVQFRHVDVMTSKFSKEIAPFLELAQRSTAERKFNLITCFSVTMWIHLNNGDDGLWKFLETVSDMTQHLIIEPQAWKCYRNAQKRLVRMRVEVPQSFREIKVRTDVVEKIDTFLLAAGRFRYKAQLGKTNWSRKSCSTAARLSPGSLTPPEELSENLTLRSSYGGSNGGTAGLPRCCIRLVTLLFVPTLVRICLVYTFLWNVFTIIAIKMESPTALGLATAMGLSVMLSCKYRVFCVLANTGDFLLHFVCPLVLAAKYLAYVEVWMALPILVADGSLIANHVYHFSPPRPLQFWAVASASVLLSNLTVPLVCVLAHWSGVPDLPIRAVQEAVAMARVVPQQKILNKKSTS
ncbi:S-adenosyl-L-methionine-dependent methyltransferase [Phytophthora cactorum]|nr:S-adenosyl-L-methionine-dependent methyltransferase [Phytophthora cactorum]